MGIVSEIFGKSSTGPEKPKSWFPDIFGGHSKTGITVTEFSAMQYTAVMACVKVISETIAALPFPVYQRQPGGGKARAPDHPLYTILHDVANEEMPSFIFRETMTSHVLLWGNAYAQIQRNNAGQVIGLWPLRPDRTWCERNEKGKLRYFTTMDDGRQVVFGFDDVFHIPGLGYNGLCGFSPIRMAMEAVGLGLAAEAFGGEFFGNGTNVGAVVTTDKVLSDKAFEHLKGSLQEKYEGLGKAHKLMLLEEGMKFARNVIPPNEAQFLETRRFQRNEIASIYRVPPHMIADLERATFSNIENQDIGFVKHTMLSWFRRWESFAQLKLFTPRERKAFFAEFSVDGLLRGDSTARAAFYKEMFMLGAYSQNDIRAKENDNPIDGGDRYWVPLNMVPIDKVDEVLAGKILPKGGDPNNAG